MSKLPQFTSRSTLIVSAVAGVVVIAVIVFLIWKYQSVPTVNADNPAFAEYIEGYTTGVISRESTLRIRFASQVNTLNQPNQEERRKLFDLSPSVKGKTFWIDAQTIEFRPDEPLVPGKAYVANFALGEVADVSDNLQKFIFDFNVITPSYSVEF